MTDATDETRSTPTPPDAQTAPPPADPGPSPGVVPGPTPPPWPAKADSEAGPEPGAGTNTDVRTDTEPAASPPLRANPDRPADPGWREPPWFPARPRDRKPSVVALIVGLVLIAIGVWLFVDRTLGITLPTIAWRSLWPVVLIVGGALILIRSLDRRT